MPTIYESLKASTIERTLGINFHRYDGDVGIEIETESKVNYNPPQMKFWSAKADGSLRDFGVEYVSNGAIARGEQLKQALTEWNDKVNKKFSLIKDSYSTSLHVHLNFMNKKWINLANFLTAYFLVENLLIRLCGDGRLSNLFCLPMCDAEASLEDNIQLLNRVGRMQMEYLTPPPDNAKYSALNICPINRLGTVEVRCMEGTTDIKRIENWIMLLLSIVDYASQKDLTPPQIVDLADRQRGEIIYTIFGDLATSFRGIKDQNKLVEKNLYFAAKLASASKYTGEDWGFPKPKKVFRAKLQGDLDDLAKRTFNVDYKNLQPYQRFVVEEMLQRERNIDIKNVVFEDGEI